MFKNKSLKSKILASFLVVCMGLAIVATTGFYALKEVGAKYNRLATVSVPNLGHISGMRARGRQIHAESIKLALYWDNPEETKKTLESLNKALKRYDEITAEKLQEPFAQGEEEVFKVVEDNYEPVKKSAAEFLTIFNSDDPEKIQKIKAILLKFEDHVREHQSALLGLDDFHVEVGDKWSKEATALSSSMIYFLVIVASITLCAALLLAYFISKNINEILLSVAHRLQTTSEKVAENSEHVAKASHNLSNGNTEQAEALHQTVSSTNEIAAMTEKTSDNSRESLKRAEMSQRATTKGQQAIEQMVHAISDISVSNFAMNDQVKKGNEEIQEIVRMIFQIGEKTKLIDDIVFQTKLLSFNVSVEAARAGEHGKGFAVVAEEMSNLADMSGRASKEISSMLTQTTQKALAVVESNKVNVGQLISTGEEKLNTGTQVVKICKLALEEIIHYIDEMCSMIKETSHSTQEQAKGVAEINKAMGQIDAVTAQNASASKQCSEAANELMSEVENTRTVIHDLMQVIHGKVNKSEKKHRNSETDDFAA